MSSERSASRSVTGRLPGGRATTSPAGGVTSTAGIRDRVQVALSGARPAGPRRCARGFRRAAPDAMRYQEPMTSDETRWQAVLDRDPRADFVYGVSTTQVYCRPSCPSRRPRRDRVRFFGAPEDAERDGYRACRRCRPADAARDGRVARVDAACAVIASAEVQPSLADLAAKVHTTPDTLRRDFQRVLGVTPKQYADALRIERLRDGLRAGRDVTGAMYDAGYGSS